MTSFTELLSHLRSCTGPALQQQHRRQRAGDGWVGMVSAARPIEASVRVTMRWTQLSQGKGGRGRRREVRAVRESIGRKEGIRVVRWGIYTKPLVFSPPKLLHFCPPSQSCPLRYYLHVSPIALEMNLFVWLSLCQKGILMHLSWNNVPTWCWNEANSILPGTCTPFIIPKQLCQLASTNPSIVSTVVLIASSSWRACEQML